MTERMSREEYIKSVMSRSASWALIPDFPDYVVSNFGDVMRVVRSRNGGDPGVIGGRVTSEGYREFFLTKRDGTRCYCRAHRLVLLAFVGPPPTAEHVVAHWDGVRLNNHVSNLRWATCLENNGDDVRRHGSRRGERNAMSKLNGELVARMRAERACGKSFAALAKEFSVGTSTAFRVVTGKSWAHV